MGAELVWSPEQIRQVADLVVRSRLFGVRSPEEAAVLMLIAQAEGEHPARAFMEYYVVNGRPALRADAMLRRFLAAGGRVEWHTLSNERAEATFSHPAGGTVRIAWTIADAQRAGLINPKAEAWQKYPRQMLRARVISEGIRTIYPVAGLYTPEEAADMAPAAAPQPQPVEAEVREAQAVSPELPQPQPQEAEAAMPEPEPEPEEAQLVTEAQLRKIWALAKERLGLAGASKQEASEILHRLASEVLGREVESLREISRKEASRIIEELMRTEEVF